MKALIDGNILLDVLQNRSPHVEASAQIWKLCETDQIEGFVSALTFADLVYIMRKELTPDSIHEVLKKLAIIFRFTDLNVSDMTEAAAMQWKDYEDAIQSATAKRIHADWIITRNTRDFLKSAVPALTPAEFLENIKTPQSFHTPR